MLYNPRAVFFTMPLALLAIGSELDPAKYEVIIVDGRLDPTPEKTIAALLPRRVVPRRDRADRRADLRRAGGIQGREARAARRAGSLGWLAPVDVRAKSA